MAVTRLKRKDRRNKTFVRLDNQRKKMGTNIEIGNRSKQSTTDQLAKNMTLIAELKAYLKKQKAAAMAT